MSKKQLKKLQHEKLIKLFDEQEAKKLSKKVMENAQKCQAEVNTCKKQQINADNSLKMIEEIKKSLETKDQNYFNLLNNLDITPQGFQEIITKGLPDEIVDIKLEEGPSHFLIGKPEKQLYSNNKTSLQDLIDSSSFLWKSLKLQFEITEQNRQKLIDKFLFNLQNVNQSLYSHFKSIVSNNLSYEELRKLFIREYTGGMYTVINSALTTSDPIKLSAMSQYINIAISAYEKGDICQVYTSNQKVYRNFRLPKDLLTLYQQNSFIYFTNMTSTSTSDLTGFGGSDSNNYAAKLVIKFLDISTQQKNKLYTGLSVSGISYYPSESEVLILPYQLFQIKKVQQKTSDSFEFELEEVDNKHILNEIRTPIISNVSKNNQPVDKQKFLDILKESSKVIEAKKDISIQVMAKKIEDFKKETVQFIQKHQISEVVLDNQVILDNNLTACVQETTKSISKDSNLIPNSTQHQNGDEKKPSEIKTDQNLKTVFTSNKNTGISKEINPKLILGGIDFEKGGDKHDEKKTDQSIKIAPNQPTSTFTLPPQVKIDANLLPSDYLSLPKLDVKKKEEVNKEVINFDQFVENLVQSEQKGQIEEVLKDYILKDLENQVPIEEIQKNQEQSNQKEQNIIQQISSQSNYLKSLNIKDQKPFNNYDFLLTLMSKSYNMIDQQTLFQETIPNCLKDKFIQRLTIQQSNKKFHKVYFQVNNKTTSVTDLKLKLKQLFDNKFNSETGQYLDLTCLNESINQGNSKVDCMCFIFQTSKTLQDVLPLIQSIDVQVLGATEESQHKFFQLCKDFFAYQGNKNYLVEYFPNEQRGNLIYYFPNNTVRLGLSVWGKFDQGNNQWLGMSNGPGEWAVVYTWISELPLYNLTDSNTPNENHLCPEQLIHKNSLQVSQCFDLLAQKSTPITLGNQSFVIGYQCRAKSSEIQFSSKYPKACFVDRSKKDVIRPYGVIIKQIS